MPFGRYRGIELDALPVPYLEWLDRTARSLELRAAVAEELRQRKPPQRPQNSRHEATGAFFSGGVMV